MSKVSRETSKKLFYRIQEVSRVTGIKPHVLRYWESEFPSLKPEKGANEQRRYRASDIELIERIKTLLYEEKFTIAGARLRLEGGESTPVAQRESRAGDRQARRKPGVEIDRIVRGLGRVRRDLVELQAFLTG